MIVALDVPSAAEAEALVDRMGEQVRFVKVGLELYTVAGPDIVRKLVDRGKSVFLDLKFHDIPNTVAKAVQALHVLEPAILTVHAAGGRAMLEDAKAAAGVHTKVVAVTVLTSLDASDLNEIGVERNAASQVERLADLAQDAGLDGIVCSGEEVGLIRKRWPGGFFVVPGVRPAGGAMGDQKRAVTPRAAIDAGASIIVVGRPISQAKDPDLAAREIEATL